MPSNKILKEKQAEVADLAEKLKNSKAGVVVNYQGILAGDDTKMRGMLREGGISYAVVKNSLSSRACEEAGLGGLKEYLKGMTAVAVGGDDPIAPAKILKEFAEKIPTFNIIAGYIDGEVIGADAVMALADIPSKETLIAKILGSLQSPLYGFAYALQAVIDKDGGAAEA